MTNNTTDRLAHLIAQRLQRLTQLRDLGLRQSELIASGELAALLRVLAAKHQIIAAVQAIEHELAPFHDQDPAGRQWPSPEARGKCAQQAEQCRSLIDEVMQLERDNERQMIARQREVAGKLQSVNTARKARTAYAIDSRHPGPTHRGRPVSQDQDGVDLERAGIDLST